MKSKVFALLLVFLLIVKEIKCQNEALNCVYSLSYNNLYSCALTMINPNGLNNIQDISGVHVDGKTDSDVTSAYFTPESNATYIPSIVCEKFKNLENLEFEFVSSYITEINNYYFVNCKKIEYLTFNHFKISKVYKNAFVENIQLQSLVLVDCELTDLPANIFPKLGNNLTSLYLDYNKLKVIKLGWFQSLTKLESLSLNYNLIEEIPINTFTNCKKLNSINMMQNKLKILSSKSFYDVANLKFTFMNNHLEAIDEKFVYNPVYQYYSLNYNWCVIEKPYTTVTEDDFSICFDNYRSWEAGKVILFLFREALLKI